MTPLTAFANDPIPMTVSMIDGSDDVQSGIWPRSATVWIVAFWTALLLIRPWEMLLPSLADLHVERIYAILALSIVLLSGQLRLLPSMQTAGIIVWMLALALSTLSAFDVPRAWESLYGYLTLFAFYFALLIVLTYSRSGMLGFVLFVLLAALRTAGVRRILTFVLVVPSLLGII